MRIPRQYLKHSGLSYYHIFSHLQDEVPHFSTSHKQLLLNILRYLTQSFFIEIIAFAILDNHFHLLVKVPPQENLKEDEAVQRALLLYPASIVLSRPPLYWLQRLRDISFFLKEFKQRVSQRYNFFLNRKGSLWRSRFHSILVEKGKSALSVSLYIDLNPIRAGISKRVDEYHWSSFTLRKSKKGRWLVSLSEEFGMNTKEYEQLLEELGKIQIEGKGKVEKKAKPQIYDFLLYRAEGLIFGTKLFVETISLKFPMKRKIKITGKFAIA